MDYRKLVETIPVVKRQPLLNKLIDLILTSKNDEKMPTPLTHVILYNWQRDILVSESGLAALLEAAVILEPDKTAETFAQLELTDVAGYIKEAATKT